MIKPDTRAFRGPLLHKAIVLFAAMSLSDKILAFRLMKRSSFALLRKRLLRSVTFALASIAGLQCRFN
jgi:hypothetical protein